MNNVRVLKTVIVVLILINIGTLAFMWFNRPMFRHPDPPANAQVFLVKELELSGSQQKEYLSLRNSHRMMLRQLQERDRSLHTRFFDQLFSEVPDLNKVGEFADYIAENRREMEVLTYNHFMQVKQILNPEQKKKFEKVFDEVLRMVLPPPPPPSPPPPPPPSGIAPPPPPPPPGN